MSKVVLNYQASLIDNPLAIERTHGAVDPVHRKAKCVDSGENTIAFSTRRVKFVKLEAMKVLSAYDSRLYLVSI